MHKKAAIIVFGTLATTLVALAIYSYLYRLRTEDVATAPARFCPEVVTPAKNIASGEIRDFPTTCIPEGWERLRAIPVQK